MIVLVCNEANDFPSFRNVDLDPLPLFFMLVNSLAYDFLITTHYLDLVDNVSVFLNQHAELCDCFRLIDLKRAPIPVSLVFSLARLAHYTIAKFKLDGGKAHIAMHALPVNPRELHLVLERPLSNVSLLRPTPGGLLDLFLPGEELSA